MAKAASWLIPDVETRKRGERTGLANALSGSPGDYGRKAKT